jgi:signal transduction histidine kinase
MSLHGEEAEKKDISVRMEVGGPVIVQGDEDLLRECVSNLIHNAIRYTPNRGQVTVSTWNGSAAGIVVRDTGVGIEKEHLDKIFDRFYRADPARGGSGSYGLGLCLAQEIARLHGTRIRVESTPGKGSRFEVVFGGDEA